MGDGHGAVGREAWVRAARCGRASCLRGLGGGTGQRRLHLPKGHRPARDLYHPVSGPGPGSPGTPGKSLVAGGAWPPCSRLLADHPSVAGDSVYFSYFIAKTIRVHRRALR